jgi:hypothetical protein
VRDGAKFLNSWPRMESPAFGREDSLPGRIPLEKWHKKIFIVFTDIENLRVNKK